MIQNIQTNDLAGICTAINSCVGSHEGTVRFHDNSAFGYVDEEGRDVGLTTLDAITSDLPAVDLIKLDVEGFELDVLRGARQTVHRFRPRFIIEFNSYALAVNRNISPRELTDYILAEFGSFEVLRNEKRVAIVKKEDAADFILTNMTAFHATEDIAFGG